MTLKEIEAAASKGFWRGDESQEGHSKNDVMAAIEIKNKAEDLVRELQTSERWDKDTIAQKTSCIIWFCARIAGMYGINLEDAMAAKAREEAGCLPTQEAKPNDSFCKKRKRRFIPKNHRP